MRKLNEMTIVLLSLTFLAACGSEFEDANDSESNDQEELVDATVRTNAAFQDFTEYNCNCFWSEDYQSEAECLDEPGIQQDKETTRGCLEEVVEDMDTFKGDPNATIDYPTTGLENFESCIDDAPDSCSEDNREEWELCTSEYEARLELWWSAFEGEDAGQWFDEFHLKAQTRCDLAWE